MRPRKRYSAWDVATLARIGQSEGWALLREGRFRIARPWHALFTRQAVPLFERPGSRLRRMLMWWSMVGFGMAIVAVLVWGPDFKGGPPPTFPITMLIIGLCYLFSLWWAWVYEHPALPSVRRRRTGSPTRALARAERNACAPGELAALGRDVQHRRDGWARLVTRPANYSERARLVHLYPPAATLMLGAFLAMPLGPMLSKAGAASWPALPCFVPIIMFAGVGSGLWIAGRVLRRLDHALESRACPDCGYDLTSVPGAFDLAATGGIPVGPARCTECGCPWPLVPPPV